MYFLDLERTEYSDSIQAVFGRALIVGTRFEHICKNAYRLTITRDQQLEYMLQKSLPIEGTGIEDTYLNFFEKTFEKWVSLCKSIKSLGLPENYSEILIEAKNARNELVHSVTIGLEGCIETNKSVDPDLRLKDVEDLVKIIAKGDFIISSITAHFNKDEVLSYSAQERYVEDIANWVIEL